MRKLLFISVLSILVLLQPVYGGENISVGKIEMVAIFPFDVYNDWLPFENPSYDKIPSYKDLQPLYEFRSIFEFNSTAKEYINNTILNESKNNLSKDKEGEEYIPFRFNDSPDYNYKLYLDMLVISYYLADNLTKNEFEKYVNDFIEEANKVFKTGNAHNIFSYQNDDFYKRYRLVVLCHSCYPEINDANVNEYKKFFRMNDSRKEVYGAPLYKYILYHPEIHAEKEHDLVVTNIDWVDPFLARIELIDVVIPYTEKQINALEENIEKSSSNLDDIANKLRNSNKVETEQIQERLDDIGPSIPAYYREIRKLRELKTKENEFLQGENSVHTEIYGDQIRSHKSYLSEKIQDLDVNVEYLDKRYWNLVERASTKLSYQQQESNLWRILGAMFFIFIVGILVDLVLTKRQIVSKMEKLTDKQIKSAREYIKKQIEKMEGLTDRQIKSTQEESKKQIEKLEALNSKLGEIDDQLKTSMEELTNKQIQSAKEENKKQVEKLEALNSKLIEKLSEIARLLKTSKAKKKKD